MYTDREESGEKITMREKSGNDPFRFMLPSRRIDILPEQADIMWYLHMNVPDKRQKELE